jgi:hypothetical protein
MNGRQKGDCFEDLWLEPPGSGRQPQGEQSLPSEWLRPGRRQGEDRRARSTLGLHARGYGSEGIGNRKLAFPPTRECPERA